MLQIHPNARTTPAIRAEIVRSDEPSGVLARRYGVSTETVRKWRKRGPDDCLDHLVDDNDVDQALLDVGQQPLQRGPLQRAPREPAVVVAVADQHPALGPLAGYVGLADLPLRVEGVELLVQPPIGALAGVPNRTTLAQLREMTASQVEVLPLAELAALLEDAAELKADAKRVSDLLHDALHARFGAAAAAARREEGKDTGRVRLEEDGLELVADLAKRVEWNQVRLAEAVRTLRDWGEDPADYVTTELRVSEARFTAWERLLTLVQQRGIALGMAFLDGTSIRAHQKAAGAKRGDRQPGARSS